MRGFTINKSKIASWFIEGMNAFLVIASVLIVGIVGLYYNVFLIEIQDLLGMEDNNVAMVESFERAVDPQIPQKSEHSVAHTYDKQNLAADLAYLEKKAGNRTNKLYEYDLKDYLDQSLAKYELPFSTVPPGRFIAIPSIGVQAPIEDIPYASEEKIKNGDFDEELRKGVVKYPHTTIPGKIGNTLLFGHSSVDALQAPKEKFGYIFYKLPKLKEGDLIQVVWDGVVHEYRVKKKMIKRPKDVPDEVNKKTDQDLLTLMACYPLMSDAQRILVQAVPVDNGAPKRTMALHPNNEG